MKYLLVIDHVAGGGAERILLDYYAHLILKGDVVKVFVITGKEGCSKWTSGVDIQYGSSKDVNHVVKKAWQQFFVYRRFKLLVRLFRPDVIFSFLEKSNLLTSIVPTKAKKILTVHNVLSIQYMKVHNPLVRRMVYAMIRMAYNRCTNVVAVSKQVKYDLIGHFRVASENIKIINNYVDHDDIFRKSRESIDNFTFETDKKYILNIGRFSDQKAQWKLIKSFSLVHKNHPESQLVLIGSGINFNDLKQLVSNLTIQDSVTFLPFNLNPYKYMAKADLFVLSSIFEGFPIVLAEVSSLRIPFVGYKKAIPEEMFDDNAFWIQCVTDCTDRRVDYSPCIHKDEVALSKLIVRGLYDENFSSGILIHTKRWELNNEKENQFKSYDALACHGG
jgi:N-acetylgalactosamine-N,N'-diacetylbacillosaminyl-diphospho-undecaprenol 4-alpha-N-acetylgalactosaminyltransferase